MPGLAWRFLFEVIYSLSCEEIFILIEPADGFPARVHQFELFTEAIFNLHGYFVILQGKIGLAEVFGDLGEAEAQVGVAGVKRDSDRGAIEGFI